MSNRLFGALVTVLGLVYVVYFLDACAPTAPNEGLNKRVHLQPSHKTELDRQISDVSSMEPAYGSVANEGSESRVSKAECARLIGSVKKPTDMLAMVASGSKTDKKHPDAFLARLLAAKDLNPSLRKVSDLRVDHLRDLLEDYRKRLDASGSILATARHLARKELNAKKLGVQDPSKEDPLWASRVGQLPRHLRTRRSISPWRLGYINTLRDGREYFYHTSLIPAVDEALEAHHSLLQEYSYSVVRWFRDSKTIDKTQYEKHLDYLSNADHLGSNMK